MSSPFQPMHKRKLDPKKVEQLAEHTTVDMRSKCWEVRDKCFDCLDSTHNRNKCKTVCVDFFSGKYCLQSWIKHYTKKRRYAKAWDFYKQEYTAMNERESLEGPNTPTNESQ